MLPYKFIACLLIYFAFVLPCKAQLPVCSGSGAGILYMVSDTTSTTTIFNYDPLQPLLSANPSINSIHLPTGSDKSLAISENINATGPSPTFYTTVSGYYYYYNGSTWVNTGHFSGSSTMWGIGAGGGFIYSYVNLGAANIQVWKYDGTGNATLILSLNIAGSFMCEEVSADCSGNFYLMAAGAGNRWLRKYNSSGAFINGWTISGPTAAYNFAIIGDTVYNNYGPYHYIFKGIIGSSNVNFSNWDTLSFGVAEFALCPINNPITVHASVDTFKYCDSGNSLVTASGGGPYTWTVLSGTANIIGSGASVNIHATGNAYVKLSPASNSLCGIGADTVTVLVQPGPAVNITSNSPLCVGDSLQLSSPSTGASYSWSGPNGFSGTAANTGRANMQYVDSGNYILSAILATCTKSDTERVTVGAIPALPTVGNNSPICAGDSLKLTASTTSGGVTYGWTGPGSFISSVQNPFKFPTTITDSGNYVVTVSLNGCKVMSSTHVSIKPTPAKPNAGINDTVCVGDTLHLNASTTTTGVLYSWTGPGSYTSSQQNPYRTNAQTSYSGNYIVTVTVNGCLAKDTVNISVNTVVIPTVSITTVPSPVHVGQSATYTANPNNGGVSPTWQWKKNGTNIPGATGIGYSYTPAAHDTICVVMHSNAPCAVPDTAKACNVATLRVNELIGQNGEWVIWPNPVTDQLTIESGLLTNQAINLLTYRLRIFNIIGQEVFVGQATNKGETRIDTKDWSRGVYIVQIIDEEGNRIMRKVVKE